jgi:hypothetical protein
MLLSPDGIAMRQTHGIEAETGEVAAMEEAQMDTLGVKAVKLSAARSRTTDHAASRL